MLINAYNNNTVSLANSKAPASHNELTVTDKDNIAPDSSESVTGDSFQKTLEDYRIEGWRDGMGIKHDRINNVLMGAAFASGVTQMGLAMMGNPLPLPATLGIATFTALTASIALLR